MGIHQHPLRLARLVAICAAALSPAVGSTASHAAGSAATAVSQGGLVATGGLSAPNGDSYVVTFVIPASGTVESPHSGRVSFSKPWVSLQKLSGPPPVGAGANPCSTVANPTSWSDGYRVESPLAGPPGQHPRSGVYVDVSCNDGAGFRYYRVRWDDKPLPWSGLPGPVHDTRKAPPELHYWGDGVQRTAGTHGTLLVRSDGAESADLSICGFDGSTYRCVGPTGPGGTGGRIKPAASEITVVAD